MTKFDLGTSSIDPLSYQRTSRYGRKRSSTQSRLDNFITPSSSMWKSLSCDASLCESSSKKPRPLSLVNKKLVAKKKKMKRKISDSSKTTTPTSAKIKQVKEKKVICKSLSIPTTPKSPLAVVIHSQSYCAVTTPKSPQTKAKALKVLNKAKRFKQMDLKKSLVNTNELRVEELEALLERNRQERQRKAALVEEERKKRKEDRLRQVLAQKEQRQLEKLKRIEWLKPREDMLCEDSVVGGG